MAFYSPLELKEILITLLQEPVTDKLITFERLGVLVNNRKETLGENVVPDEDNNQLYACSVCKKKLISAHLLDLHVVENHDTYFELQKDKKPMVRKVCAHCSIFTSVSFLQFACYLEECKHMSVSPEDRKDHCIKLHKFPHDFRFDKVGRKKSPSGDRMDTSETATTSEASSTKFKVNTFHFGNKSQKTFQGRSKKSDPIESMIVDLKATLPEV